MKAKNSLSDMDVHAIVTDMSRGARFLSSDGMFQLDCANVNRSIEKAYKVARVTNTRTGQVINDAWDSNGDLERVATLVDRLCHWSDYTLVGYVVGYSVSCAKECGFTKDVAYINEKIPQKCPKCPAKEQVGTITSERFEAV